MNASRGGADNTTGDFVSEYVDTRGPGAKEVVEASEASTQSSYVQYIIAAAVVAFRSSCSVLH